MDLTGLCWASPLWAALESVHERDPHSRVSFFRSLCLPCLPEVLPAMSSWDSQPSVPVPPGSSMTRGKHSFLGVPDIVEHDDTGGGNRVENG